ncbi:Gfo/Idh/MocA family protein [Aquisphaera insulae]|uniref:Gfo/Idh/MocA family protein n=1 Tax=Aquisphaera insulae TaxID=2712864 RepID=UPI0013E9B97E|nr:Gfo/Idh/MocA family oxidoreductase [Aquisphaera insulae]
MTPSETLSRRRVLAASATAATFTIVPRHVLGGPGHKAPSETLNVAGIGVGGIGSHDVKELSTQNIVALCDVDRSILEGQAKLYPKARIYSDYRKMLDAQKDIDAVTIATPDHSHAIITMAALRAGKHVHCQKPLTHSVYEARAVGKAAREAKVATQMGNYGQASEEHRLMAELIWAGAVGTVQEVHAGSNRYPAISPRGIPRPKDTPPVPANLDWDVWVGPAPIRPYHPSYHPFAWRGWWDFGSGVLGDIACHELSPVFKALKLQDRHPDWVEACSSNHQLPPEVRQESAPMASITRWHFAAGFDRPALTITWWDGGLKPARPEELEPDAPFAEGDWMMIVGDKGKMLRHELIPARRAREFGPPPRVLERSPGHYVEWINACKGGHAAGSNFDGHAAHLAEVVQLGNIALRTPGRLAWDPVGLRFTNSAAANALVNPPYRSGWYL